MICYETNNIPGEERAFPFVLCAQEDDTEGENKEAQNWRGLSKLIKGTESLIHFAGSACRQRNVSSVE